MSKPLFFLHIPKTAGTTLNAILDDNFDPATTLNLYTDEQRRRFRDTTYDDLARYDLVRGHVFISNYKDILDGPLPFDVFTFLRDPVDRVVSEYWFLKSWPKSHIYIFMNENDISLAEYVTSDRPELRMRGRNAMVNSLSGVGASSLEEGVEMAWHHLRERFIAFGLLERFDESVLLLNKQLDLGRCFYERQNVRSQRVHRPISKADVELVQEYNQADIALYEKAYAEFDRRVEEQGAAFRAELRLFLKINEKFQRVSDLIMERDGVASTGDFVNGK